MRKNHPAKPCLCPIPPDKESILQNLKDAGCSPAVIQQFLCSMELGDLAEELRLLARQRKKLLEELHDQQRSIDCLDYLVYNLENQGKTTQGGQYHEED